MTGDLDLPFEANPPGMTLDMSDAQISDGLVATSTVPLADGSTCTALVYRFARPDGSGFYPPILLVAVADADGMAKIVALTNSAATAAIAATS